MPVNVSLPVVRVGSLAVKMKRLACLLKGSCLWFGRSFLSVMNWGNLPEVTLKLWFDFSKVKWSGPRGLKFS